VVLEGEGLIKPDAEPSDWLGAWLYGKALAWGSNSWEAGFPGCCEVKQLALLWVERNLVFFAVTEDLIEVPAEQIGVPLQGLRGPEYIDIVCIAEPAG
jgi:hypothetical protein